MRASGQAVIKPRDPSGALETLVIIVALAWAPAASAVAAYFGSPAGLKMTAAGSLVGGLAIFLRHGGRFLTAAGIYCATLGVMTASGEWYWAINTPLYTTRSAILMVGLGVYLSTAFSYIFFWRRSIGKSTNNESTALPLESHRTQPFQLLGAAIFATGLAMGAFGLEVGSLARTTAEVGAVVFAGAGLLGVRRRLTRHPIRVLTLAATMITFYLVVFQGGGRIRLAAMVLIIVVLTQHRVRTNLKPFAVAAVIPIIAVFAIIGQARVIEATGNPEAEASAGGLGSLVNPLQTYAEFTDHEMPETPGETFLASAVALVPRSLWPDKPVQFGSVVTRELRPSMSHTNLSKPCLSTCEWYYNYSWLGLVFAIPVVGLLIRWLDRAIVNKKLLALVKSHDIVGLLVLSLLVGSMTDLAWGGIGTWVSRNSQRILVLAPVIMWALLSKSRYDREAL